MCRREGAPSRVSAIAVVALALLISSDVFAQGSPYVAIVECEDSYQWSWEDTHSSSQAVVGLAGLVGVPYETLLLRELLAEPSPAYTSVWFSSCPVLTDDNYAALDGFLIDYTGSGGNVFVDGPLGNYRPDPMGMFGVSYRGMDTLAQTLKVIDGGWFPIGGYAVTAAASDHPIAQRAGYEPGAQLSQGLIDGTETVDLTSLLDPNGAILLEVTSAADPLAYPLLVATETDGGGRVVAVGAYGNYVGPASPFHNEEPAGFYDNKVLPYLVEALVWLEHGDQPAVGLQLSHAPMTAVGRLDGDWSNEPVATEETFRYLIELAETTGLASAYGIVSDFVPEGGWERFRNGGIQIEALGGAIGSHSHTHDYAMSANLDDAGWLTEVTDSLALIRSSVSGGSFNPDVDVFINPGDTIEAADYHQFFNDVELYMSHGFETSAPYSSGVMGFGLPDGVEPTAVVNNTPAPDFQWFYLEEWRYTVDEAANYQAQILDYYQHTVKRGAVYNQMWHDYSIGGDLEPVHFQDTETVRPLFDANRDHFARHEVYMPSIDELVGKLHIAKKARHTKVVDGDRVTVTIDYSAVPARYRRHAGGMGLRIAHAGAIRGVTVDGSDRPAFTADTVILPEPASATQVVEVTVGDAAVHPRLSFISKPFDDLTRDGDALTFGWSSPGLHRKACVTGPAGIVLLHADTLTRTGVAKVCGTVAPSSSTTSLSTTVLDPGTTGFYVDGATRPIMSAAIDGLVVTLAIGDGDDGRLELRSEGPPVRVEIDGERVGVNHEGGGFELALPDGQATVTIELMPCEDVDGDGASDCAGDCDDGDPEVGICEPPGGCCSVGAGGRGSAGSLALSLVVLVLLARRRRR